MEWDVLLMDENCGRCRFWSGDGSGVDMCRRNPPTLLVIPEDKYMGVKRILHSIVAKHPPMYADDWCGEFKRRIDDHDNYDKEATSSEIEDETSQGFDWKEDDGQSDIFDAENYTNKAKAEKGFKAFTGAVKENSGQANFEAAQIVTKSDLKKSFKQIQENSRPEGYNPSTKKYE